MAHTKTLILTGSEKKLLKGVSEYSCEANYREHNCRYFFNLYTLSQTLFARDRVKVFLNDCFIIKFMIFKF